MAISLADETASCAPQSPRRLLRVHTWPQGSKDANLRKAYIAAAAAAAPSNCQTSPSADFLSPIDPQAPDMAISSFAESHHNMPCASSNSGCLQLPLAEADSAYTETPSRSLHNVQDVSPSCVNGAVVRRKGRKDVVRRIKGRKDVYLCYKDPHNWFPHQNNVLSPNLPFLFKKAIYTRQKEMPSKIRLMVCEGTQVNSNAEVGDVMIFPEMFQYKGLTVSEIESFVEDVLVHERNWISGSREKIRGTYIFVQPLSCMSSVLNGASMTFNGLDGATLPEIFKSEGASRGLDGEYVVKSSLQIHGHKQHGNVTVYSPNINGLYTESCWSSLVCYGSDVAVLIDMFSGKTKTMEDVLKRHVEKPQDASKDKQWLQHRFSSLKTSYALATLASLSVVVVIGTLVAFRLSKKAV